MYKPYFRESRESEKMQRFIDDLLSAGFKKMDSPAYEDDYLYRGKNQKFLVSVGITGNTPYYSLRLSSEKIDTRERSPRRGFRYYHTIGDEFNLKSLLDNIKKYDLPTSKLNLDSYGVSINV